MNRLILWVLGSLAVFACVLALLMLLAKAL
jgi:hypothetical protein